MCEFVLCRSLTSQKTLNLRKPSFLIIFFERESMKSEKPIHVGGNFQYNLTNIICILHIRKCRLESKITKFKFSLIYNHTENLLFIMNQFQLDTDLLL